MYEVYRRNQRRRMQTVSYTTYSHLQMTSEWEFQPFGPLGYCLDTLQQPDCEVTRGPFREVTVVTYLLSGTLTVEVASASDVQLGPRDYSVTTPRDGDSIVYRTGTEEAHFVEIGLTTLSDDSASSNRVGHVSRTRRSPDLGCLVSGQGHGDVPGISLDSAVYRGYMRAGENLIFETLLSRKLFLLVLRGTVRLEQDRLLPRDAAFIRRVSSVPIAAVQTTELLLVDMA
ncbi:MAG: hypothetical protein P8Z74_08205 [Acidobacteriota bacterium]|jgi:redox-sensitive bicupin YhaK (pirin superfamily)